MQYQTVAASLTKFLAACFSRTASLLFVWPLCHLSLAAGNVVEAPSVVRRDELITLVRQDCGSCHGLTLKGGLGPALLPETLKHQSASGLKATILRGRPGTAMPPWQQFMTEAEAEWIVAHLQKGFPIGR